MGIERKRKKDKETLSFENGNFQLFPSFTKQPETEITTNEIINITNMMKNNTQTSSEGTTQLNMQHENASYPHFYGYYGGHSQDVYNLYLTTSEHPAKHENQNQISQHYYENGIHEVPIYQYSFDRFFYPYYELRSPGVKTSKLVYNSNFSTSSSTFGITSEPEFINSGFNPSFSF